MVRSGWPSGPPPGAGMRSTRPGTSHCDPCGHAFPPGPPARAGSPAGPRRARRDEAAGRHVGCATAPAAGARAGAEGLRNRSSAAPICGARSRPSSWPDSRGRPSTSVAAPDGEAEIAHHSLAHLGGPPRSCDQEGRVEGSSPTPPQASPQLMGGASREPPTHTAARTRRPPHTRRPPSPPPLRLHECASCGSANEAPSAGARRWTPTSTVRRQRDSPTTRLRVRLFDELMRSSHRGRWCAGSSRC